MFRKTKKSHSSCNTQSIDVCSKNKSVDSSLGGLSRSSTLASLDTDSSSSSGASSLDVSADFKVRYLGAVEGLPFPTCRMHLEPEDLIGYVDAAQEEVLLGVYKHGVRVASPSTRDVVQWHPLRLVVQLVGYEDGLGAGRSLLALKTTDVGQQECSIWVYQCMSAEQAQAICKLLSTAFNLALV